MKTQKLIRWAAVATFVILAAGCEGPEYEEEDRLGGIVPEAMQTVASEVIR